MTYRSYLNSKVGFIKVEAEDAAIISIQFVDESNILEMKEYESELTKIGVVCIQEYLEGKRSTFDLPLDLRGTAFQKDVWKALLEIPYGTTKSYKDIARMIGRESASRAVGFAIGKNPVLLVVPCHRVIGSNGEITGYAGGVQVKEKLLKLEKENLCMLNPDLGMFHE